MSSVSKMIVRVAVVAVFLALGTTLQGCGSDDAVTTPKPAAGAAAGAAGATGAASLLQVSSEKDAEAREMEQAEKEAEQEEEHPVDAPPQQLMRRLTPSGGMEADTVAKVATVAKHGSRSMEVDASAVPAAAAALAQEAEVEQDVSKDEEADAEEAVGEVAKVAQVEKVAEKVAEKVVEKAAVKPAVEQKVASLVQGEHHAVPVARRQVASAKAKVL